MSGSGAGFFNRFSPWGGGGGGGGQQGDGQRGPGRGGNHPERRPHGPGGPADTSHSRAMATMSLPTMAETTPGAVI
jgi:hypothetical protein